MLSGSTKHSSEEHLHDVHISQGTHLHFLVRGKLHKGENVCTASALIKNGNGRWLLINVTLMMVGGGVFSKNQQFILWMWTLLQY